MNDTNEKLNNANGINFRDLSDFFENWSDVRKKLDDKNIANSNLDKDKKTIIS